ncbi:hypothetical protein CRYUN_Cryun03dG0047000 [Craigia yunnanensis]
MKFWKSLSILIEEALPDWRDKFLSYKDLKKQLKLVYPKDGSEKQTNKRPRLDSTDGGDSGCKESEVSKEVMHFVLLLEDEMEKFNAFFVEKEEDYVIKWRELQDRVAKAKVSNEELMKVGREIVDFHGEMVLLENYSALNYTGLVKIIKKYDKRSGALVRLPFIQKVLQQPFYRTDVLNKLVKECEMVLDHLFSKNEPSASPETTDEKLTNEKECKSKPSSRSNERILKVPKELAEIKNMENMYMKLTLSALRVLKEIRSGSSTFLIYLLFAHYHVSVLVRNVRHYAVGFLALGEPKTFEQTHVPLKPHTNSLKFPRPQSTTPFQVKMSIVAEAPGFLQVFFDGSVKRSAPEIAPASQESYGGYKSKDVIIDPSKPITGRIFIPDTPGSCILLPGLVYFHGGGFCICSTPLLAAIISLEISLLLCNLLSLSIDCCLAPEHLLSMAYDDCYSSLECLCSQVTSEPCSSKLIFPMCFSLETMLEGTSSISDERNERERVRGLMVQLAMWQ